MGNSGERRYVFSSLVIMVILLAAIPAMSAYDVKTVTDPTILLHSGDVIKVSISDLKVGNNFKYQLTSTDLDTIGDTVISNTVDLPIGFKSYPVTHLSTTGYSLIADPLTVDYNYGGVFFRPTYAAGSNPIEVTKADIKAGHYVLTLKGTKIPGATTTIEYSVAGIIDTVPNPDPQILTFTIKNANSGHLTIEVFDGADKKFSEIYTIGPHTPAPVPTQNGGGGGDVPAAPVAPVQLAPPGFPSSTITLLHNDEGKVLADYTINTDRIPGFIVTMNIKQGTKVVTIDGKPVNQITLTPLDPATAPDANGGVYSFLGIAVECDNSGTQFSPQGAVTLSFTLSPELWIDTLAKMEGNSADMTIGFYDTASGTWTALPTTVDPVTRTVTTHITHFSTYGLISKSMKEAPATSPQTFGRVSPTPTYMDASSVPKPTTYMSQMAPPEANHSPGLPGVAVIGTVLFVGYFVMRKKQ